METEGTLSAAQMLSPTQPMNKPAGRRMNPSNEEFAANDFRLLLDGKLVEGAGTLDVINPATGRVLTTAPRADRGQLDRGRIRHRDHATTLKPSRSDCVSAIFVRIRPLTRVGPIRESESHQRFFGGNVGNCAPAPQRESFSAQRNNRRRQKVVDDRIILGKTTKKARPTRVPRHSPP